MTLGKDISGCVWNVSSNQEIVDMQYGLGFVVVLIVFVLLKIKIISWKKDLSQFVRINDLAIHTCSKRLCTNNKKWMCKDGKGLKLCALSWRLGNVILP